MIDPESIARFLKRPPILIPNFKEWDEDRLLNYLGGLQTKTKPRLHQLAGIAFAQWGQRVLLHFDMRLGKALQFNTQVATPNGWQEIGSLQIGDMIMSPSGNCIRVTGVFPQGLRQMYRVIFSDGAESICDAEHLWAVNSALRRSRGNTWQIKTLAEIQICSLIDESTKSYRYFIPRPEPIKYPKADVTIDPYTLGVFLGDGYAAGTPNITTDLEIVEQLVLPEGVTARNVPHTSEGIVTTHLIGTNKKRLNIFAQALKNYGLSGALANAKFVPIAYRTGSVAQRWELLQGLLDTDGTQQGSNLHWGTVSKQLAKDVQEIVRSLGGTAKIRTRIPTFSYKGEKKTGQLFYQMSVRLPATLGCPFRLLRKANKWKPLTKFQPQRAIKSIEQIEDAEAICISVDAKDGLFVIGDYVVTHNTKMSLDWAAHLSRTGQWPGLGLIIAHAPIALEVWKTEAEKHSNLKLRIVRGNWEDLIAALGEGPDLIVMHWHGLQSIFTTKKLSRKGVPKLYPDKELLRAVAPHFSLVIIDEIHTCNNHTTLRFLIAQELVKNCQFRVGLTGTPLGRNPLAIWAQAYLIDEGETLSSNYYFFERAFGIEKADWFGPIRRDGKRFSIKFNDKYLPILKAKLSSLSLSYKRGEVQSEDIQAGLIELQMQGEQRAAYTDLIDKVIRFRDDQTEEITNTYHRLRQVSSGYLPFNDEDGGNRIIRFKKAVKTEWLNEFLAELPEDLSCVIFHEYTETGRLICDTLKKAKVKHEWLYGGTKDRHTVVAKFQGSKCRVLVANSAVGGTSIDLNCADYLLFFESPASPVIRAQAEARPMGERLGRTLFMDDLMCSPVEKQGLEYIKQGKDLSSNLIFSRKEWKL